MYLIRQVAEDLGVTKQAIYKSKKDLMDKGYMKKNDMGNYELSSAGFEYLKEKRLNKIKQKELKLNDVNSKNVDLSINKANLMFNKELNQIYEDRIKELQDQVEYFKNLYEQEKKERVSVDNQYKSFLESLCIDK